MTALKFVEEKYETMPNKPLLDVLFGITKLTEPTKPLMVDDWFNTYLNDS